MGQAVEHETKGDIDLTPAERLQYWLENEDRRDLIEVYLSENGELKGKIA